jgi:hypothetical protein
VLLAPADFGAFVDANPELGLSYPVTAADRARMTPAVIAWKQDQEDERNEQIATTLGISALGLGGLGAGAWWLGNRSGASPGAAQAPDAAVDGDWAAPAASPIDVARAQMAQGRVRPGTQGVLHPFTKEGDVLARQWLAAMSPDPTKNPMFDPVIGPKLQAASTPADFAEVARLAAARGGTIGRNTQRYIQAIQTNELPIDLQISAKDLKASDLPTKNGGIANTFGYDKFIRVTNEAGKTVSVFYTGPVGTDRQELLGNRAIADTREGASPFVEGKVTREEPEMRLGSKKGGASFDEEQGQETTGGKYFTGDSEPAGENKYARLNFQEKRALGPVAATDLIDSEHKQERSDLIASDPIGRGTTVFLRGVDSEMGSSLSGAVNQLQQIVKANPAIAQAPARLEGLLGSIANAFGVPPAEIIKGVRNINDRFFRFAQSPARLPLPRATGGRSVDAPARVARRTGDEQAATAMRNIIDAMPGLFNDDQVDRLASTIENVARQHGADADGLKELIFSKAFRDVRPSLPASAPPAQDYWYQNYGQAVANAPSVPRALHRELLFDEGPKAAEGRALVASSYLPKAPAIARMLGGDISKRLPQEERIQIAAEALGMAVNDMPLIVSWGRQHSDPQIRQLAELAYAGGAKGNWSLPNLITPYVKRAAVALGLERANAGAAALAPSIELSYKAAQALLAKATLNGMGIDEAINQLVGDTTSPLVAAWRITNQHKGTYSGLDPLAHGAMGREPYAIAETLVARFSEADDIPPESQLGQLRQRLDQRQITANPNAPGAPVLPIRVMFGGIEKEELSSGALTNPVKRISKEEEGRPSTTITGIPALPSPGKNLLGERYAQLQEQARRITRGETSLDPKDHKQALRNIDIELKDLELSAKVIDLAPGAALRLPAYGNDNFNEAVGRDDVGGGGLVLGPDPQTGKIRVQLDKANLMATELDRPMGAEGGGGPEVQNAEWEEGQTFARGTREDGAIADMLEDNRQATGPAAPYGTYRTAQIPLPVATDRSPETVGARIKNAVRELDFNERFEAAKQQRLVAQIEATPSAERLGQLKIDVALGALTAKDDPRVGQDYWPDARRRELQANQLPEKLPTSDADTDEVIAADRQLPSPNETALIEREISRRAATALPAPGAPAPFMAAERSAAVEPLVALVQAEQQRRNAKEGVRPVDPLPARGTAESQLLAAVSQLPPRVAPTLETPDTRPNWPVPPMVRATEPDGERNLPRLDQRFNVPPPKSVTYPLIREGEPLTDANYDFPAGRPKPGTGAEERLRRAREAQFDRYMGADPYGEEQTPVIQGPKQPALVPGSQPLPSPQQVYRPMAPLIQQQSLEVTDRHRQAATAAHVGAWADKAFGGNLYQGAGGALRSGRGANAVGEYVEPSDASLGLRARAIALAESRGDAEKAYSGERIRRRADEAYAAAGRAANAIALEARRRGG